jgi:hypothetical protein
MAAIFGVFEPVTDEGGESEGVVETQKAFENGQLEDHSDVRRGDAIQNSFLKVARSKAGQKKFLSQCRRSSPGTQY